VYLRFVISSLNEFSGRREGLFQAASALRDSNTLTDYEADELAAIRAWFNHHLEAPDRFSRSSKSQPHHEAICWYKDSAKEHISRMHEMCRILREHGILTHVVKSERPGYIVYEDDHQVAAVPFAETDT
jgi:hypothetical protein